MTFDLNVINKRFRRMGEITLNLKWLLLAFLLVLDIVAVVGLQKVQLQSSWESFFFDDDPIKKATDRFEEYFGNSNSAAILVSADDVFSPRVLRILRELGNEIEREVPYVDKVTTLSEFEFSRGTEAGMVVGNLVPDLIPTDPRKIEKIRQQAFSKENLINKLFSDDSKQTWISIKLKEYPENFAQMNGGTDANYIVGEKLHEILAREKYRDIDLKETGMPVIAYDKTNYYSKEAGRIILYSLIAAVVVLIVTLRSVPGVIVPLITMVSSIMVSYGFMGFMGIKIDSMVMTIPLYLALAVSIGYSIHIFNFFTRRFKETGDRRESVLHAIENTGWPLFFTALTTIGCMFSFNFVDLTMIQWIGNTSASLITIVYIYAMILTPLLLSFGKDKPDIKKEKKPKPESSDRLFTGLGNFALKNGKIIVIVFLAFSIVMGVGVTKVQVDFDMFRSSGLKIPYVKRLWDITQSKIGSMYSYDVTIELPEEGMAKDPEVLRKFEELESRIKVLKLTKHTTSILDIIKDMNRTLHNNDKAFYRIPESRELITQLLFLYEMSGGAESKSWLDVEDDYRILRLNVSIDEFLAVETEREMEYIEKISMELFPGSKFGMVGTCVEGAIVNNYVAEGQLKSFLIALLVIAVLMIIIFRSVKAGLIGLIPNLTPVLLIGGVMGYLEIPLNMMTMTVVPMLLGIAVDDSIHFINHVKLEVINSHDYDKALLHTFRTVGKALFMTSLILIITFGMYMTSEAKNFFVMGALVGLGLFAALVADYLVTPILIKWSKPFGEERVDELNSVSDNLRLNKKQVLS